MSPIARLDPCARLRNMLDNVPAMIGYWDKDLRNQFGNQAYATWFGIDPQRMPGMHIREVLGEERFELNRPFIEAALRGERQVFERAIPTPAGDRIRHSLAEYIPDLVDGEVQGFFVQVSDISQVKEAHAALQASEERLRGLFELSPLGIGLCDLDGRFIEVNEALCRICGYTAAELKQLDYWALTPEDYAPAELLQIATLQRTGRYGPYEKEYRHKAGHRVAVQLNGMLVTGADGKQRIWSMVEDIGERRSRFLALIQAKEMVEVANRAKSAFLAAMSHELHTPMNAVLGLLRMLKGTPLSLQQLDEVEQSENAARSLLALLDEILEFSNVEADLLAPLTQPFRLDQLLRELAPSLSANSRSESVEVLFDVQPKLPEVVSGDIFRLKQVLTHLCSNAFKFTSAGEVVVSVRLVGVEGNVAMLEFAVSDTGCGIAFNQQQRIFEAFTRVDASTERYSGGAGLGLAISRRLVALMGGTLKVQSTLGVGSRFYFSLPMPIVLPVPTDLQLPPISLPPALEVLVVDDKAVARGLMLGQLLAGGMVAAGVDSGAAALQWLKQRCTLPTSPLTVVLLDWQMPGMDGWETARQIKALDFGARRPPRLIMVSANGRDQLSDRAEAEQARLSGFLAKPFSSEMLLGAIAQACVDDFAPCQPAGAPSGLSDMRILVVEDNPINQMVAQELLSREGALVSLASNGQLGVEAVANADPPFDVVLMDLQMPVLDGCAAARVIRQQLGLVRLPIVALSANALPEDIAKTQAAGMDDHVGKPFDLPKLVALLRRLVFEAQPSAQQVQASRSAQPAQTVSQAAVIDLQQMGKINFAKALDQVGGDTTLYRRFALGFVQDTADYADRLALHLGHDERRDAMRIMHTLNGLSATIGADQMADFAASKEAELKQAPMEPSECNLLVQQTRDGIAVVSAEVLRIVESIDAALD